MRSECPFCGFESSVHVVQAHIDRDHTPSSGLQLASRSPAADRTTGGAGYRLPPSDPLSVRERQIITRRYPVDEPSWIKCGVLGCGMYVPERKMNDHLDMHDMQAEDVQRARRLHEMSARSGGAGFPSLRGPHPSSRTLRRMEWGLMMGNHDYDDISVFSQGSGGSERGSSLFDGAGGGNRKPSKSKRDKHGDSRVDGSGKDSKDSGRKDARRGWSRNSTSGKNKEGKGSGSSKSVKSSSSSVVTTFSRARSERGGGGGEGGGGEGKGGSGRVSGGGGGSGDNRSRGAGGSGPTGGDPGDGNGSKRGSGRGDSGSEPSGSGPSGFGPAGSGGKGGGSPGGGNPGDLMFGSGSNPGHTLASTLGGTGGPHATDMGGLEFQLAKLLLANRASSDAGTGTGPGAPPSFAPGVGSANPGGGANLPMATSPAATNEFMQALQRGMRPQGGERKSYGLDQRIPSEAANLLAAIVASRAAGGGY